MSAFGAGQVGNLPHHTLRVGFHSPLPPARTGVADYSASLLTALRALGPVELSPSRADVHLYHIGNNGAIQARLEATKALATTRSTSLEQLVSKEADADLSQTLVKLSQTQTAYQAALQTGGKILNTSLLDYLR